MTKPPAHPKIFHITHVDNLPSILGDGCLWSDAERLRRGLGHTNVAIEGIKRRRLWELEVGCHPGTHVGDFVPFYFCPRSVMLYLIHMGNHPDVLYQGGQGPILHLRADLEAVVRWADNNAVQWAFSDRNAGARYACFYNNLRVLSRLNWPAIHATDFRYTLIKEGKQAEFLLYGHFPWHLVECVGVHDQGMAERVGDLLAQAGQPNVVSIQAGWYY